jgi:hypothetical protein
MNQTARKTLSFLFLFLGACLLVFSINSYTDYIDAINNSSRSSDGQFGMTIFFYSAFKYISFIFSGLLLLFIYLINKRIEKNLFFYELIFFFLTLNPFYIIITSL